jgi:putative protease
VLNAPFYHPLLQEDILSLAERAYGFGVHAFIVSDQGLLKRLAMRLPGAKLTLSTMAGALNAETVKYYRRFSIERVVLPRHLTLNEMGAIIKKAPGLQYEAFVLIGKCPNEEAYCTFQHTAPSKRWPCEIPYRYSSQEGFPLPPDNGAVARRMAFQQADRRMGCGLCAVEKLLEVGVGILKLVGRGGPTAGKIANVKLAVKYAKGQGGEDARADYLARFGRGCSAEVCYFPELYWSLSEKEAVNGA